MANPENQEEVVKQASSLVSDDPEVAYNDNETETAVANPEIVTLLKERETFTSSELLPIVTSISCGMLFGIAFNKSRIFEPFFIIEQMLFTRFLMLKFFLAAAGTSCVMGVIASHFYPQQYVVARSKFLSANNAFTICLGSLILGTGMSVSGSCPGTVMVQVGAGVPNSGMVVAGLLSGALVYGLTDPLLKKLFASSNVVYMKYTSLNYKIPGKIIGIGFGTMFWSMVVVFEWLWPWQSELNTPNEEGCNFLCCGAWPPEVSGFIVGLLQIILISVLGNGIGTSSSYICIMGQWLRFTKNDQIHETFQHFANQLNRWWQVLFMGSAIFGSWIAVGLNSKQPNLNVIQHPYDEVTGVSAMRAVVGGFLMIIGSRMAKGCPSGHGFSGFMFMTTAAMIAVPGIFVGGIATAFVFQSYGL